MARPERQFYMTLALRLGRTLRELLSSIDSRELSEWIAFDGISPIGPEREDFRAGIVASVVANCNSTKGKFKPSDFVPKFGVKAIPKTGEQLMLIAQRCNALLGGKVS